MERTKIIFCSAENTAEHELEAFYNANNNITLIIKDPTDNSGYYNMHIELDKITAIKFVKHLKREISYMESEVSNG